MTKDEVIAAFGVDPEHIGNRPRSWWIVDKVDDEVRQGNAAIRILVREDTRRRVEPNVY